MAHKQKLTYEYVKKFFEENNCKMLDTEYKNARTHINYQCSCGNISKIIFDSFRRGHRCMKCSAKKKHQTQPHTYIHVYDYFKEQGCELLEKDYIDAKTKMRYRCSCGDIGFANFNNFKRTNQCSKCSLKGRSGQNHYEWIKDRDFFEDSKKFRDKCHKLLRNTIKRTGQLKNDRTCSMLGYSFEDLQIHVRNFQNWEGLKNEAWHLDHIFPIKAFLDYGITDIKLINCLDNLQPLSEDENIKKSGYYEEEKFEEWLTGKGYEI